jgi:hypothetical protein
MFLFSIFWDRVLNPRHGVPTKTYHHTVLVLDR